MLVYVNDEQRELHVYDRITGKDYAKAVLCSQERLDTGVMGEFVMSEEEYKNWQDILSVLQESEDIRYDMKDIVDKQELADYIYEDTQYIVHVRETAQTENVCLKEVAAAIHAKDKGWLLQHGFSKTAKKITT